MTKVVKRPINGISINGREYLLDKPESEGGVPMEFPDYLAAAEFLSQHGYDITKIGYGIEIVDKDF